jgi:CRISPR-associated endonuclease/helicase Cas3
MEYYAHSLNNDGCLHLLKEHLLNTANLMKNFACKPDYVKLFWMTGLFHDIGKYQDEFQKYIKLGGIRGSVPHAAWGAGLTRKIRLPEVAFAIDGHHKGIPDKAELQTGTQEYQNDDHPINTTIKQTFLQDLETTKVSFNTVSLGLRELDRELFIRYLFSSLTDSDWLDTEKHFHEEISILRKAPRIDCPYLIQKMEQTISEKDKNGYINRMRNYVREYALSKANSPIGFFSMSLPTGMGKTLASVSWALLHAKKNQLKRIIIVLPFVNIIEQTSKELKKIFGDGWVLEHHSAYNEENTINESLDKETNIKKLATENWDYPIIVTTSVQFFDSLFSNKPKRCRKVHNIAEAVVIFDEVQNLPKELTTPTISMLGSIHKVMRTSFLFCTATQPAFEKRADFPDGIEGIVPLVKEPEKIYVQARRINYNPLNNFAPITIDKLLSLMAKEKRSILSIYNTKKATLKAFYIAKKQGDWDSCFHLSTAMCPDHRKQIITKIKAELSQGKTVFAASTQLIEAGVDIDFPCVFREIAPLESIIQSAGRCNREGRMNNEGKLGDVYIFRIEESKFPDQLYQTLAEHTLSLIQDDINKLYTYSFFTTYYATAVKLFVDTDRKQINTARKNFDFETVAGAYHLIDNKTTSLFIVNYNQETRDFFQKIEYKPLISKDEYRYMQIFSVQVYDNFLKETTGQWEEKEQGFYIWYGSYEKDTGISSEPILTDYIQ